MTDPLDIEAYWSGVFARHFSKQEATIIDNLNILGAATRAELVQRTGIQLSAVCGRVKGLIDLGIIEEFDKTLDTRSGKRVWKLRVKENHA